MTLTEKIFALKATPCFAHLDDGDLTLIADVTREREYAPGERFCPARQALKKFYVVIRGSIRNEAGAKMPGVLGPASLLLNMPVEGVLRAAEDTGATCLVIGKGHFYTIVYQFPSILTRLLEMNESETGRYDRERAQ